MILWSSQKLQCGWTMCTVSHVELKTIGNKVLYKFYYIMEKCTMSSLECNAQIKLQHMVGQVQKTLSYESLCKNPDAPEWL